MAFCFLIYTDFKIDSLSSALKPGDFSLTYTYILIYLNVFRFRDNYEEQAVAFIR